MKWVVEKLRAHRTEVFLALSAMLLFVSAIDWGLPNATGPELDQPWGHDDIAPLGPLAEIHNTFIEAKADRFLAYPLMHYFFVVIAYAPYLLYLLVTGRMVNPVAMFPYGLLDPVHTLHVLSLIARSLAVLMAAGTVVAAYKLVRTLWNDTCGILAGIFVMLLYPMFYYSRTGNLDVPALFWGAVGLVVYARILRGGYTVRRGIWLGVFAAMSAGTKDQGAALFLLMPLILLPLHFWYFPKSGADSPERNRWYAPAVTLAAGLMVYLVSSGFIFRPERYFAHIAWITGLRPDSPMYFGHPATWEGYIGLLREFFGQLTNMMSLPLLVVAMVGILMAALRDRLSLALLVPVISLLLTVIIPTRYVEMRFVMPIGFILACFAAWPVGAGLLSRRSTIRAFSVFLAIGLCVLPLLHGVDLTYAMLRDSRYAAADWLNTRLQPGDRIEFFGPYNKLPHLKANIKLSRAVKFVGIDRNVQYTSVDIHTMARGIVKRSPNFVLIIPDGSSQPGFPYGTTCPVELYNLLQDGSLGYQLAASIVTKPIFSWIQRPPLDFPVVNPRVQIFAHSTNIRGEDVTLRSK
jgi:hypothetical protein